MRLDDVGLPELLEVDPATGVLHFAGQRVLVFDAVALGMLRRDLIQLLGTAGARAMLTRFGYAHGWRTAETLKGAFPWENEIDWRRAGGRIHGLQGIVKVEPVSSPNDAPTEAQAVWHASYEAEQHVLHIGRSDEPVCWTLCGFASGYLSFCTGQEVIFVEDRCLARGDAACHVVGRTREAWGEAIADYLPFYEKSCLEGALRSLTDELRKAERRLRARSRDLGRRPHTDSSGIVARDEPMQKVLEVARRSARVDAAVLLSGESGVGKERVARLIHDESARAHGPFVAINCAAVTESLLESELFGHARGSFTGAMADREGLFEAAHGGTLLLDEVSDIPLSMQVKLLRVLQEREVRRVGENKSRPTDVRIIAATNRDLAADVKTGTFRKDLYYRLRVVEIRIPPLRERRADILPLARTFLAEYSSRLKRKVEGLSTRAVDQLLRYDWPGNVRELQNAIERAVALCQGPRIELADLPEEIRAALPGVYYDPNRQKTLANVERDYILATLRATGGHRAKAAEELGIGTATLYRKLKEYGVKTTS